MSPLNRTGAVEVYALGELLIDLVATAPGRLRSAPGFFKAPGGAPANVAVGLSRLGVRAGFLGKVGEDEFGAFLRETLVANGVEVSGLTSTARAQTTLAFVSLTAEGERDFLFYREPGADTMLTPEEIDAAAVGGAAVLHHGSISLIAEPSRSATLRAVEAARSSGAMVSFDANLRPALWPDLQAVADGLRLGLSGADLVKLSGEELLFLAESGADTPVEEDLSDNRIHGYLDKIDAMIPGARVYFITLGARGSFYRRGALSGRVPGFAVKAVDTTGTGDAFMAGVLYSLLRGDLSPAEAARFGNAVGALAATKYGAIPALPSLAEVEAFLVNETHFKGN